MKYMRYMCGVMIIAVSCISAMDRMDANIDLSDVPEEMLAQVVDLIEAANIITDESCRQEYLALYKKNVQENFNFKKRACKLVELLEEIKTFFTQDKAMEDAILLLYNAAKENLKVVTYELSVPALLPLNPEKHESLLCSDPNVSGKYAIAAYRFLQEADVCEDASDLAIRMSRFQLFKNGCMAVNGDVERIKKVAEENRLQRKKQNITIDDCKRLQNWVRMIYFAQDYDKPLQEALEEMVRYHYTNYLESQATLSEIAIESMIAQCVIVGKERLMFSSVAPLLCPQIEEELAQKTAMIVQEYEKIDAQERTRILPFLKFIEQETRRVFDSRILPNKE